MYTYRTTRDFENGLRHCLKDLNKDWLLVWKQNNKRLTLLLTNTGTHDELFKKK